ncbi:MAG TPA: GntR family transcriptional regulator [Jatrophihabitantaceae bacterium]|jgi:DNA-binding transcriptional regulator YhcF (GntR family)|nr:GntR family transcriptional regulator [Jatrophihabitantaceae bacterium]
MALRLEIDTAAPTPPFEQVRAQLAAAIASGELPPHTQLPPVRRLASDLGLAANTVARAYRELELAHLVETRGRNGTVVAGTPSATRARAERATQQHVTRLRELGVGDAEILALVRRALEQDQPGSS